MKLRMVLAMALLFSATVLFAQERKEYVVAKGDTLSDIMTTLKKEGVDIQKLSDWNPNLKMHYIQVGQTIVYYLPDASPKPVSTQELDEVKKIAGKIQTSENINQERLNENFNRLEIMIAVGGLTLIGILLTLWFRKEQSVSAVNESRIPDSPEKVSDPFSLLNSGIHVAKLDVNPTKEMVMEYIAPSTEKNVIIIMLRLQSGMLVPCIVQKLQGCDPLVFHTLEDFKGSDSKPNASWKHKKNHAAQIRSLPDVNALSSVSSQIAN